MEKWSSEWWKLESGSFLGCSLGFNALMSCEWVGEWVSEWASERVSEWVTSFVHMPLLTAH